MRPALGFDFDHTLGLDNKLELTIALETVERLCSLRNVRFERAVATPVIEGAIASFRNGAVPLETALEGVYLRLAGAGPENADEAMRFREVAVNRAAEFVRPLPGLKGMLAALSTLGIRYAMLTNGWSPLQETKARLVGFDAPVLVSERITLRKPQPEAFDMLAAHLGVPTSDLWYVGDDPLVDCGGALGAGASAVWFDWEGRRYPADLARPTYVIHSLDELTGLLQGHLSEAAKGGA
ncbi:MAG: HAD family hydrolase [Candidatus Eremiobacteraeota bacterium]|nr:HAD family hydrolase [Candidatus Eremiobacteraeota bacterium]